MKRTLLSLTILISASVLLTTCAKINTDQPCGSYNGTNQPLFKDGSGNCYYIDDNNGKHVYVTNSTCNC